MSGVRQLIMARISIAVANERILGQHVWTGQVMAPAKHGPRFYCRQRSAHHPGLSVLAPTVPKLPFTRSCHHHDVNAGFTNHPGFNGYNVAGKFIANLIPCRTQPSYVGFLGWGVRRGVWSPTTSFCAHHYRCTRLTLEEQCRSILLQDPRGFAIYPLDPEIGS